MENLDPNIKVISKNRKEIPKFLKRKSDYQRDNLFELSIIN